MTPPSDTETADEAAQRLERGNQMRAGLGLAPMRADGTQDLGGGNYGINIGASPRVSAELSAAREAAAARGDFAAIDNAGKPAQQVADGYDMPSGTVELPDLMQWMAKTRLKTKGIERGDKLAQQATENNLAAQEATGRGAERASSIANQQSAIEERGFGIRAGQQKLDQENKIQAMRDQYLALDDKTDPTGIKRNDLVKKLNVLTGSSQSMTVPQHRINAEIDAARSHLKGLSAAEIKRRTAQYSETGRENPDYDPLLADKVQLSSRRKYGEDDEFDSPSKFPAGQLADIATRFADDPEMKGRRLGKQTQNGVEVFDEGGKLIGYWN